MEPDVANHIPSLSRHWVQGSSWFIIVCPVDRQWYRSRTDGSFSLALQSLCRAEILHGALGNRGSTVVSLKNGRVFSPLLVGLLVDSLATDGRQLAPSVPRCTSSSLFRPDLHRGRGGCVRLRTRVACVM